MTPSAPPATLPGSLGRVVLVVRALCVLGMLTLVAVPIWFWLSPDNVLALGPQMSGVSGAIAVDDRARALGAAVSLLPVGIGLYALWQLWKLFAEYGAGRVFGRVALARLKRFAWALLAAASLAPLVRAAMSVVLTLGNPPGQRQLVIGFSWDDYLSVLLAVVLIAIATVMAEAVRLAEENEGFV
ncbi:MAG: DUF2975 domain-containing protein [Piscinibacter sp.]|uniref:DUF2975 domain-containing protein n=1 Tax=Piscinibacter sp. TaxID=1903157 RepID=UPI003D0B3DCC